MAAAPWLSQPEAPTVSADWMWLKYLISRKCNGTQVGVAKIVFIGSDRSDVLWFRSPMKS